MEVLNKKYQAVLQAYKQLNYIIQRVADFKHQKGSLTCNQDHDCLVYRDSLIKRFEFCYDVTWKFLKSYLEVSYALEVALPKKVFQECVKQKIVTPEEATILLEMVEARNNASHTYNEVLAQSVADRIPSYYEAMVNLMHTIVLQP